MKEKKIVVVDDEKEIADLVEVYLTNEGYRVYKFYNGLDAFACICNENIDMAILDIMLPDIDGFSLCKKIRETYYFPIIMLTAKIEEMDKINGMVLGADDYVTKPFQPLELMARVKAQFRRVDQYNRALTQEKEDEIYYINGLEVDAKKHECKLYDEPLSLTPIEFDILLLLCRNQNQVLTSEQIFEKVWKEKYLDSNNTVFVHIARLREKMGENSRKPKFIKTVWGIGYKIESGE